MAEVLRYLMEGDPMSPCGQAAAAYVPPSQAVSLTVKPGPLEEPLSPSGPGVPPTYVSPVVLKAPHAVLEKSQCALSEASTTYSHQNLEDLVYERPSPSEGSPSEGAQIPARV